MNSSQKQKLYPLLVGAAFIFALVAISCNLPAGLRERFFGTEGTLAPTPAPTFTPQPLPPTIVETDPPAGSNISLSGSITFYFNQAMDQNSVENALTVLPLMDGSFTWQNDATLTYKPKEGYSPGTSIKISLETTAAAFNGLTLTLPVELEYFTPDWLKANIFLPLPGSIEIDPLSAIVVTFNQPVVSLGSADQELAPGFRLSPAVSGEGSWINTSTYQFTPSDGLAGGVTYRADLSLDLVSTAGAVFAPDTINSWTFSTLYPQILSWGPYDGKLGVPLDASINMTFNQAMDPESVEGNFSLVNNNGEQVKGTLEWSEDNKEAYFIPELLLERLSNYAAILPGEVLSTGKTPLQLDTSW